MAKLPVISGSDAIKAFKRGGWYINRQRGSHVVMLKPGNIASLLIPMHQELAPGTLRALIRAAGITLDEFLQLLKG
jgi:predicted RNA binding protein YcfA (HicA-like mRNA interferase family)